MMASSLVALAGVGFDNEMTNHRVHFAGLGDTLQARCSCKQKSPIGTRSDVEAWKYEHEQMVQRVRAHLGTRNPTLKTTAAWFEAQAANPDVDPEDRVLWKQLAEETGAYIARKSTLMEQDPLF